MTVERAIVYLGSLKKSYGMAAGIDPNSQTARELTSYIEALRMAVEALETKKNPASVKQTPKRKKSRKDKMDVSNLNEISQSLYRGNGGKSS